MERQSFARARLDLLNEVSGCCCACVRVCACACVCACAHEPCVVCRVLTTAAMQVTAEDDKLQRALDASFAHLGGAQRFGGAPGGGAPPSPIPHHRHNHAHGTGRRGRGSALDASAASGGYARAAAGGRGKVIGSGSQEG